MIGLGAERAEAANRLLASVGAEGSAIVRLGGGANNRVFQVQGRADSLVLKAYFSHSQDSRDRLGAEWAFLSYASEKGILNVPKPIAKDPIWQLGLYSFLPGVRVQPGDVDESAIRAAVQFIRDLQGETDLMPASEACFSIGEHCARVGARVERLKGIETSDAIRAEAKAWVEDELVSDWRQALDRFEKRAARLGIDAGRVLTPRERCISPSDFGFHNALRASNQYCFLDFEYAGWDDPAKLVCDFFCQPAVPVPRRFFDGFASAVASLLPDAQEVGHRIRLLLPIYERKWLAIMLNEFLPVAGARRAYSAENSSTRLRVQLDKAKAWLSLVRNHAGGHEDG